MSRFRIAISTAGSCCVTSRRTQHCMVTHPCAKTPQMSLSSSSARSSKRTTVRSIRRTRLNHTPPSRVEQRRKTDTLKRGCIHTGHLSYRLVALVLPKQTGYCKRPQYLQQSPIAHDSICDDLGIDADIHKAGSLHILCQVSTIVIYWGDLLLAPQPFQHATASSIIRGRSPESQ